MELDTDYYVSSKLLKHDRHIEQKKNQDTERYTPSRKFKIIGTLIEKFLTNHWFLQDDSKFQTLPN